MADRAQFLARKLIARLATLEASACEEGVRVVERRQRRAMVEKVLAVELGLTDGAAIALVESALPQTTPDERARDRETAAVAEFLRRELGGRLTES